MCYHYSLFGSMSVLRVYRDISFLDLQTVILKLMAKHLRGGEVTQTVSHYYLCVGFIDHSSVTCDDNGRNCL